ncbi:hypothetical protein H8E77_38460 [bacterium]|nr:hypothetical protein [bacterium]
MNHDSIVKFQNGQRDAVAKLGAFLTCLESYSKFLETPDCLSKEIHEIRKLQPIVGEFMGCYREIHRFLNEFHYVAYAGHIGAPGNKISKLLANQTMPSKHIDISVFKQQFEAAKTTISEAMIAIAQIASSPIDTNLLAGNSFSAYCFINSIISTSTSQLIIVDPYIDKTVFYRYLCGLDNNLSITIASDSRKLKGNKLAEFESVEVLYKKEYPNYSRNMYDNLHDRYLVNEVNAYNLGGSIVHAAYKSDFSVVELTKEKRVEIVAKYT